MQGRAPVGLGPHVNKNSPVARGPTSTTLRIPLLVKGARLPTDAGRNLQQCVARQPHVLAFKEAARTPAPPPRKGGAGRNRLIGSALGCARSEGLAPPLPHIGGEERPLGRGPSGQSATVTPVCEYLKRLNKRIPALRSAWCD